MKLCLLLFVLVVAFALNEALNPACRWDGTTPICAGKCTFQENLCKYDKVGNSNACFIGKKALCCARSDQC
uniref:Uncharacterized protein n=1 Tax=Strigamia maritima TaxID=126957 RepID=T1J7H3_STRMM